MIIFASAYYLRKHFNNDIDSNILFARSLTGHSNDKLRLVYLKHFNLFTESSSQGAGCRVQGAECRVQEFYDGSTLTTGIAAQLRVLRDDEAAFVQDAVRSFPFARLIAEADFLVALKEDLGEEVTKDIIGWLYQHAGEGKEEV